jgi:hypothetical protein
MTSVLRMLLALCAFGLLAIPASSAADGPVLHAVVGPGTETSFVGPDGRPVIHLVPGTYTIVADDRSDRRDFTLQGPGVSLHTGFEAVGTRTWTATFSDGWYRYYDAAFETDIHAQLSVGSPPPVTLTARVDDSSISFRNADGSPVRHLERGTYSIAVHDGSQANNLRIVGPGVEERTQVFPVVDYIWTLTFGDGTYSFFSERHTSLHGTFTAGTAPVASRARLLHAIVGPDFSIALVDANWQPVRMLPAGTYAIDVDDRGNDHNFRLHGPRVDRATTVPFVGHKTWTFKLSGGLYFYRCDPHDIMFGQFTVKAAKKPAKKPAKKHPRKKRKRKPHR